MLRDQIAALRAMQDAAKPAPIISAPAGLSADDAAKVASLERRVADAESKCGEIPALQRSVADVKGTAAKVPPLEDQVTAMRAQIASITGAPPPPPPPAAAPTGGGADSAKVADLERRLAEQEETTEQIVGTIEEIEGDTESVRTEIKTLRQKMATLSGDGADEFLKEDVSKAKAQLKMMKEDITRLNGWKQGKEKGDTEIFDRLGDGVRDAKKSYVQNTHTHTTSSSNKRRIHNTCPNRIADLQNDVDNLKVGIK